MNKPLPSSNYLKITVKSLVHCVNDGLDFGGLFNGICEHIFKRFHVFYKLN